MMSFLNLLKSRKSYLLSILLAGSCTFSFSQITPIKSSSAENNADDDFGRLMWVQTSKSGSISLRNDYYIMRESINVIHNEIGKIENEIKEIMHGDQDYAPKGPFETTVQYNQRLDDVKKKYQQQIEQKIKPLQDSLSKIEGYYFRTDNDGIVPEFRLENYNADKGMWKVVIKKDSQTAKCEIKINPEDAKKLWENRDNLQFEKIITLFDSTLITLKITHPHQTKPILITGGKNTLNLLIYGDDTFYRDVDIVSSFPSFEKFLANNLGAEVPSENGAPPGQYTIVVSFIVNIDGSILYAEAENNPGYGMAEESVRVIKKSNKWTPAMRNGKPVASIFRQPITFVVSE